MHYQNFGIPFVSKQRGIPFFALQCNVVEYYIHKGQREVVRNNSASVRFLHFPVLSVCRVLCNPHRKSFLKVSHPRTGFRSQWRRIGCLRYPVWMMLCTIHIIRGEVNRLFAGGVSCVVTLEVAKFVVALTKLASDSRWETIDILRFKA
jgi:hypothetical protein